MRWVSQLPVSEREAAWTWFFWLLDWPFLLHKLREEGNWVTSSKTSDNLGFTTLTFWEYLYSLTVIGVILCGSKKFRVPYVRWFLFIFFSWSVFSVTKIFVKMLDRVYWPWYVVISGLSGVPLNVKLFVCFLFLFSLSVQCVIQLYNSFDVVCWIILFNWNSLNTDIKNQKDLDNIRC